MPLIDFDDPALWDGGPSSLYSCQIDGETVGYVRAARDQYYGNDPSLLLEALVSCGLQQSDRIAFIGAGFGWVEEVFRIAGYENAVSVDASAWIQANKEGNAVLPILDADVLTSEGRALIGAADWAISEDCLPCLSDGECQALSAAMRDLAQNVAHWVSVGAASGDARLNWKSLIQWKELVAPDLVIQRGTSTVL